MSLGELQPACAGLEGLQGLTDGAIIGGAITSGVSQGESASLLAAAAGYGVTGGLSERLMQGALPAADTLASGGGSAALRISLAACGNAVVPEKLEIKSSATARMLLWAYITFSRPDL